jgi:hypothetical protein
MKKGQFIVQIVMVNIFICILLSINACSEKQEEYKRYVQNEGDIRFSFSYPDHLGTYQEEIYPGYVRVWFTGNTTEDQVFSFIISLNTYKAGAWNYKNAEEMYQDDLTRINKLNSVNIIQNTVFENDIIHGKLIEFSYKYSLSYVEPLTEEGRIRSERAERKKEVYFDYHDYIWEFSLMAPPETYETEVQAFETILDSLEVYD